MKYTHKGNHRHRLRTNRAEAKFAAAWEDTNRVCNTLQFLLGDGSEPDYNMTQRDCLVAATVIQWLGSPVGGTWLKQIQDAL